jgi:hypothetical protein
MTDITWDEFARVNRIPVWPGLRNHWQLLTSELQEGVTAEQVASALIGIMTKWCGGVVAVSALDPSMTWSGVRPTGAADDLTLVSYGPYADVPDLAVGPRVVMTPEQRRSGAVMNRMSAPGPVQRLAPGPVYKVVCSFSWRSQAETLPWPVWRGGMAVTPEWSLNPLVPKSWVLDRVLEPTFAQPEQSVFSEVTMPAAEAVLESSNQVASAAGETAMAAGKVTAWIVGGMLVLLGAGLAIDAATGFGRRR